MHSSSGTVAAMSSGSASADRRSSSSEWKRPPTEWSHRPSTALSSSSSSTSSTTASSDELMSESYGSSPSPSPPSPSSDQQTTTQQPSTWPHNAASSSFLASSFASLAAHSASAAVRSLPVVHVASHSHAVSTHVPQFIRSASGSSFSSTTSSDSPHSSSLASSPFHTTASLPAPAFHLQPDSPRYVDTYLSLVSTDVYSFFDDPSFHSLYRDHLIHISSPHPRTESRARLLCVSAVLAVGARMYGNTHYSDQCAAVARYCARSIRHERPASIDDTALAYRGVLVLSYLSAAMLDASEAEWLAIADWLLAVDGARSLIPASLIHVLQQMPPTYLDALTLPASEVCEHVVRRQTLLYSADAVRYRRCKHALRQSISVAEDDEELSTGQAELLEAAEGSATDITASVASCSADKLACLHRSVCLALSSADRRPSLRFSVHDSLITALCCEAAALPTSQRSGAYSVKLACYLLLGNRREAVQAARDTVLFHIGPGRLPSQAGPSYGLMLPFLLSFVRSIVVLVEWDDSHDVPSIIAAALRLLHGVSLLWPAARSVESELMERIHGKCRAEMSRASSQAEMERSDLLLEQCDTQSSSGLHHSNSRTGALQTAIRMELALEALEIEWQSSLLRGET